MLDISIVTYNSAKHLPGLIASLIQQKFPLDRITLSIHDNNSSDNTVELLDSLLTPYKERFESLYIHTSKENLGFGCGHNAAISRGKSPYIFIVNPDTALFADTLTILMQRAEHSPSHIAAWEARQLPHEHPKHYNPITLETEWVSGAAVLLRRSAFEAVKGFDPQFFLYGEDVDLSYRLRNVGFALEYCPKASLMHFSYSKPNEIKAQQLFGSTLANLFLRARFGTFWDVLQGVRHYLYMALMTDLVPNQKSTMLTNLGKFFSQFWYFRTSVKRRLSVSFHELDYTWNRLGAFTRSHHVSELPKLPKVSILIRTIGRKNLLKQALQSVSNQTYTHFEVVLIEDGPATLDDLAAEFSHLSIHYHALGRNQGRCVAGNEAMKRASGEYFVFLDDDDLFYADHLEQLVGEILKTNKRIVYSYSFEIPSDYEPSGDAIREEGAYFHRYKDDFCFLSLLHHNYIPILNVLFHNSLYEEQGGFNVEMDLNEDWDLWLRYSLVERPFAQVKKTTALYRIPMESEFHSKRFEKMHTFCQLSNQLHSALKAEVSVLEVRECYERILAQRAVVYEGRLERLINAIPLFKRTCKAFVRGARLGVRMLKKAFRKPTLSNVSH